MIMCFRIMTIRLLTSLYRNSKKYQGLFICKRRTLATNCKANGLVESLLNQSIANMAEVNTEKLKIAYIKMNDSLRSNFLNDLASNYQGDHEAVSNQLRSWNSVPSDSQLKREQRLREALTPQYEKLFTEIGSSEGGVKFLVDMRRDLLQLIKLSENLEETAVLKAMNHNLKKILSMWFGIGFFALERITWTSSCDLLQKIAEYEGVHPIRSVADLRVRVGSYRRCYAFLHASMPREPIVVLHTALVADISSNIQSIVKHPVFSDPDHFDKLQQASTEDPSAFNTAIFYSITSTQAGLQGIELGNYLIKKVVKNLLSEFPHLQQFSSLSPIPGFRDWLITEINQRIGGERTNALLTPEQVNSLSSAFKCQSMESYVLKSMKAVLLKGDWYKDENLCTALHSSLTQLCANYLFTEKRRTYALNPVANFHLRNGATLWRVNWLANTTARGMTSSCGLMVNYRYFLDKLETNSEQYIQNKIIDADEQVLRLIRNRNLSSKL